MISEEPTRSWNKQEEQEEEVDLEAEDIFFLCIERWTKTAKDVFVGSRPDRLGEMRDSVLAGHRPRPEQAAGGGPGVSGGGEEAAQAHCQILQRGGIVSH